MTAFTVERLVVAGRFDAILDQGREAYLASPVGKARKAIAKAHQCSRRLTDALNGVSTALTIGNGSEAARTALFDAMLDLRIACGDVEALARLIEAS